MKNLTTARVFGYVGLGLILVSGLIITSTRAIRVIQATLPDSDHLMAYCALGMVGFGVILWALVFRLLAQGPYQRAISLSMVFVCLAGDISAMFLDGFINTSKRGLTAAINSDQLSIAVIAVFCVIGANIAATLLMELVPTEVGGVNAATPTIPRLADSPRPATHYSPPIMPPRPEVKVMQPMSLAQPASGVGITPANPVHELKESESRPGHFANEVAASPFLPTMAMPKNRNGEKP